MNPLLICSLTVLYLFAINTVDKRSRVAAEEGCDPEKNKDLKDKSEKLSKAKDAVETVGEAASAVAGAFPGYGTAVGAGITVFTKAVGWGLGYAADQNKPPSEELEYMKCIKKELDELKKEMRQQFEIVNKKLDHLQKTVVAGFEMLWREIQEVKDMIQKLRDELAERWRIESAMDYNKTLAKIDDIKEFLATYDHFAGDANATRNTAIKRCDKAELGDTLKLMRSDLVPLVLETTKPYYPLLRAWCNRIYADLISVIHAHMFCITLEDLYKTEEARKRKAEEAGKLAEEIVESMETTIREVKKEILENATEIFEKKEGWGRFKPDTKETHIIECRAKGDKLYEHLTSTASWNDWIVETLYVEENELAALASFNQMGDGTDAVASIYHNDPLGCWLKMIPCERRNSEITKENVQHFVKWATTKLNGTVCPWIYRKETQNLGKPESIQKTLLQQLRFPELRPEISILIRERSTLDRGDKLFRTEATSDALAKGVSSCIDTETEKAYEFLFYICFS